MSDAGPRYRDKVAPRGEAGDAARQIDQGEDRGDSARTRAADLRSWADGVGLTITGMCRIHKERVKKEVEGKLTKLDALSYLDEDTRSRLRPAIAESEELLTSREWASTFRYASELGDVVSALFYLLYRGGILVFFIVEALSFHLNLNSLVVAVFIALQVLVMRVGIHDIFWWRLRPGLRVLTAAILIVGSIELRHWWGPALANLERLHDQTGIVGWFVSDVHWPDALYGGMWFAASGAVIGLIEPTISSVSRWIVDAFTYRKTSPAIQTALLIDSLLEIAYLLETKVKDKAGRPIAYLSGDARVQLVIELDRFANRVAGPWSRSMRTGGQLADAEVPTLAKGIAAAVLKWQPQAALGGSNLQHMCKAFSVAVVNACDSDWHLFIAEAVEEGKSIGKRILEVIRRAIIAAVPFLLSVVVVKYFSPVPVKYHEPIILVGFTASLVYILTLLDSKFADMLTFASRLTEVIRK